MLGGFPIHFYTDELPEPRVAVPYWSLERMQFKGTSVLLHISEPDASDVILSGRKFVALGFTKVENFKVYWFVCRLTVYLVLSQTAGFLFFLFFVIIIYVSSLQSPTLRHFTPSDSLRTYENRTNNHMKPLTRLAPKRLRYAACCLYKLSVCRQWSQKWPQQRAEY